MTSIQLSAHSTQPTSLRGWVNTYYRHYKGKRLGPYYVRRWKVGRKVYREYIKPENVERVRAACQAHREGRTRISRFLDNFDFLGKMMDRYDTGRVVTHAMEDYIRRIHSEGPYITGRPQMRRRVTRNLATIDGKEYVVKTIFELDGTTKEFMVPFFINSLPPEERQGEVPAGGMGAYIWNDWIVALRQFQNGRRTVRGHCDGSLRRRQKCPSGHRLRITDY